MGNNLMQTDLSVWGMYQHADIVVKIVMIGLILASVVTWAIFFSKSAELLSQKRRLKREQQQLAEARSLDQASDMTSSFHAKSLTTLLVNEAQNELELSAGSEDNEGIKERTGFRLERRVAAVGRPYAEYTPGRAAGSPTPSPCKDRRGRCSRAADARS